MDHELLAKVLDNYFILITGHQAKLDNESLSSKTSWKEDILYLLKNKSFILSTIGFTCLCFFSGGLSWWGPHFITDTLQYRNVSGIDISSDPNPDKYENQWIIVVDTQYRRNSL